MIRRRILISLDCLFDTRLGTVELINSEAAIRLINSRYLFRTHNKLSLFEPSLNDDEVNEKYKNRDIHTLRVSKRTKLVSVLTDLIRENERLDNDDPEKYEYEFILNTYPYELTQDERITLNEVLSSILGIRGLKRIHRPIKELGPEVVRGRYDRICVPDFSEWFFHHHEAVVDSLMPMTVLTVPFALTDENIDNGHSAEQIVTTVTEAFIPIVTLEFIHLADISIDYDLYLKQLTNEIGEPNATAP